MTHVILDKIQKIYPGTTEPAVDDFSLDIPTGKLVAFLGPSGCGKTTTLKMIAGLINPTAGKISFDGEDIVPIPSETWRGDGLPKLSTFPLYVSG